MLFGYGLPIVIIVPNVAFTVGYLDTFYNAETCDGGNIYVKSFANFAYSACCLQKNFNAFLLNGCYHKQCLCKSMNRVTRSNKMHLFYSIVKGCKWETRSGLNLKIQAQTLPKPENNSKL